MPPHKKSLLSVRLPAINKTLKPSQLMGCASSQAAEIKAQQNTETAPIDAPNNNVGENKSENENNDDDNKENSVASKYPPGEAFEIPLGDLIASPTTDDPNSSENIIKKHPPKRLQRLVEQSQKQQQESATTIEDLEEKLAKAEIRRQKFLQQRVDTVLSIAQPISTIQSSTVVEKNEEHYSIDNDDNEILTITTTTINNEIDDKNVNNDQNNDDNTNYTKTITTDHNKYNNLNEIEHNNFNSNNNNKNNNSLKNEINHSNLRNYTRVATPAATTITSATKKIIINNDTVNKDEKYRSPGDGDESKENLQI